MYSYLPKFERFVIGMIEDKEDTEMPGIGRMLGLGQLWLLKKDRDYFVD